MKTCIQLISCEIILLIMMQSVSETVIKLSNKKHQTLAVVILQLIKMTMMRVEKVGEREVEKKEGLD